MSINEIIDFMYAQGATHETIVSAYKMARPQHETDVNQILAEGVSDEEMVSIIKDHEADGEIADASHGDEGTRA